MPAALPRTMCLLPTPFVSTQGESVWKETFPLESGLLEEPIWRLLCKGSIRLGWALSLGHTPLWKRVRNPLSSNLWLYVSSSLDGICPYQHQVRGKQDIAAVSRINFPPSPPAGDHSTRASLVCLLHYYSSSKLGI